MQFEESKLRGGEVDEGIYHGCQRDFSTFYAGYDIISGIKKEETRQRMVVGVHGAFVIKHDFGYCPETSLMRDICH